MILALHHARDLPHEQFEKQNCSGPHEIISEMYLSVSQQIAASCAGLVLNLETYINVGSPLKRPKEKE